MPLSRAIAMLAGAAALAACSVAPDGTLMPARGFLSAARMRWRRSG